MCDACAPVGGWTRRRVLASAGAVSAALVARPVGPALAGPMPAGRTPAGRAGGSARLEIFPRSAWAADEAVGPIADETDVRFLLVHHTVNGNAYPPADVVGLLRDIHRFHTTTKRWPDIAYNFVVDRFGRAWETRAGSIERPVAGDATGGSQGFDQKCAFLGDHRTEAPTAEATATMAALLAFLADRAGIDTRPGATTTFESRGSNLHPAGTAVTTPTITGHRTMSQTACPGDAGFAVVRVRLPAEVTARRGSTAPPSTAPPPPPTAAPDTAPPATTAPTSPADVPSTVDPATTAAPAAGGAPPTAPGNGPDPAASGPLPSGAEAPWSLVGAGGLGAVLVGGMLVLRNRRSA